GARVGSGCGCHGDGEGDIGDGRADKGELMSRSRMRVVAAVAVAATAIGTATASAGGSDPQGHLVGRSASKGAVSVLFAGSLLKYMEQALGPSFERAAGYGFR